MFLFFSYIIVCYNFIQGLKLLEPCHKHITSCWHVTCIYIDVSKKSSPGNSKHDRPKLAATSNPGPGEVVNRPADKRRETEGAAESRARRKSLAPGAGVALLSRLEVDSRCRCRDTILVDTILAGSSPAIGRMNYKEEIK